MHPPYSKYSISSMQSNVKRCGRWSNFEIKVRMGWDSNLTPCTAIRSHIVSKDHRENIIERKYANFGLSICSQKFSKKCGRNCLSHRAQLPVLNRRKSNPIFHESSNYSFNISYLGYYWNLCLLQRIFQKITSLSLNQIREFHF